MNLYIYHVTGASRERNKQLRARKTYKRRLRMVSWEQTHAPRTQHDQWGTLHQSVEKVKFTCMDLN